MKAVIFDMDGVLLDTESVCNVCWRRAGQEFEIADIEKAIVECIGMNNADIQATLQKYCAGKVSPKYFLDRTSEIFHEIERTEGLKLMPYVKECLDFLKSKNIRMAVASSTRWGNVERQLKNAGIFDYFESITTGDKVEHSKPEPDIYLKSLESLNLKAEDCISVEDSPNGIRSSVSAGIRCVMVPDQIQPNEELKKLSWKIINSLKDLSLLIYN